MPADDTGGNLVTDTVGQNTRVISAPFGNLLDHQPGLSLGLLAVEEAQMLSPGNIDQDTHPLIVSLVEKPLGRFMIGSDGVNVRRLHHGKVVGNDIPVRKRLAVDIWRKRTVSNALNS